MKTDITTYYWFTNSTALKLTKYMNSQKVLNEVIVSLVLMILYGRTLSCRRTLSIDFYFRLSSLRPPERGFKRQTLCQWQRSEMVEMKWLKEQSKKFRMQGYMFSFEGGTLLSRKTETMLRRRDVIQRWPASFWCMIHVPMLEIIPLLKVKALLFDLTSCIYIYIYI